MATNAATISRRERLASARSSAGPRGMRSIEALLDASIRQLSEKGWRDITVEHVLLAAGVSRATFYRYFADLRDVLHVLVQVYTDEVTPVMDRLYANVVSGAGEQDLVIEHYVRVYQRYAGIARIWAEEARQDPILMRMATQSSALPRNKLRSHLAARPDVDADATFLVIYALIDRFPFHAFGVGAPGASSADTRSVTRTMKVMLDGIARAQTLLASGD
ncbi:TetR/AcrR family transcriptional regulator [Mycobacterium sp. SMC-8]|uniref:TetR/AcrR family transcriptional regulator n=1 Tax=Mycobacterium sp. SMC-8 TaxID=2857060 RepID=UPI0021B38B49|nr:TetR/AcrR family transcriptional regulator [Mycobacterium sp. SMC-8]UXA11577.1 TetR/AcrR family transcriptional regulator [Mycobacterium sp. SMC-8]